MATAKITTKLLDENISIKLNVRHKTERKQIHILTIPSKFWDKKRFRIKSSHPDHIELNATISGLLEKVERRIRELDLSLSEYTLSDILTPSKEELLLSVAIENYASTTTFTSVRKYRNLKDKILSFGDITISEVDTDYIRGFIKFLQSEETIKSQVTVHRYTNLLKTILRNERNQGRFNNPGVIDHKVDRGTANKKPLTFEELMAFEKVDVRTLHRDSFMLSFYTLGTRIGDVLQFRGDNIENGRLVFREQKTTKFKSVSIIPEIKIIIERYEGQSEYGYLLPILTRPWTPPRGNIKFYKHIQSKTSEINRSLKIIAAHAGIKKTVTTHIARHTFANWAKSSLVQSRSIKEMMNFSSLQIMENYFENVKDLEQIDKDSRIIFNQKTG